MAWIIRPLVGLGDVKFSMSQSQVAALLDPIQRITSTDTFIAGTLTEFRGITLPVCNYKDGCLRCMDTHWSMAPLLLDGADIFALSNKDLLASLERRNGRRAIVLHSTVFYMSIGLSASNYLDKNGKISSVCDEDDDERGIGVFGAGVFDDMLPHAKPISFLDP